jgi:hypothetical protein
MINIFSVDNAFDLTQLAVKNPISKNGTYFMKFASKNNQPLYFQAPQCTVRQGFVKSGTGQKKLSCDFVFNNNDDDTFLSWLETLEETTRSILYTNREKWFATSLEESDIENSMMPPYKSFKSGKCYVVRTNVPTTLGKSDMKIYNEDEKEIDVEAVTDGMQCLVIFEFKGIRCSSRSFQFDIELKQMLVVQPKNMFEKCVMLPKRRGGNEEMIPVTKESVLDDSVLEESVLEDSVSEESNNSSPFDTATDNSPKEPLIEEIHMDDMDALYPEEITSKREEGEEDRENNLVNTSSPPTMQLKSKNEIYVKMYREARAVAREAKMIAFTNYLEAKRIKNTYLLASEMSESEDDEEDIAWLEKQQQLR